MKSTSINLPFLLLTCGLISGILLASYFPRVPTTVLLSGVLVSLLVLGTLRFWAHRNPQKGWCFGIAIIPVFIVVGYFLVQLHNPLNHPDHYTNRLQINKKQHTLLLQVQQRLKPSKNHERYVITLRQSDSIPLTGKVLLYVPKDSLHHTLEGNQYLTYAQLQPIKKPRNLHQFDYAAYLEKQGIYYKIRLAATELIPVPITRSKSLQEYAIALRNFLIQQLDKQSFTATALAITKALVLGQRQDIDPETYQNYVNAGAIHILAVSGLHIGIFLWLLHFLFRPLLYLKHGKKIRLVLSLLVLWSYAYITGLSPSVCRAVTMFSFIAIGQVIRPQKGSPYNALLISGFLLLCFDPLLLFDVGFQLSYTAVFAIFWIQPWIAQCYHPRFFLDRLYWGTLTVTLAAQIGVLPLSIYYFHQFPLLFFITNLAIVPGLGILLGLGLVVVVLAAFGVLPKIVTITYNTLIQLMNTVVAWVADKETFLWSDLSISTPVLIVCYLVVLSGIMVFKKFHPQRVYRFGILLVVWLSLLIAETICSQQQERFIVFHQYKNTLLAHQNGNQLTLLTRDRIASNTQNYLIQPYTIAENIQKQSIQPLVNAYRYKKYTLLLIDRTGIYNHQLAPEILILTQSPKIHLDRVIDSLAPQQIIADGTNYSSMIKRWKVTCKRRGIPFYSTAESGAFVLE